MHRGRHARVGWGEPSKHWPAFRALVLVAIVGLAAGVLIGRSLPRGASPTPPIGVIEPEQSPDSCEIKPLAPSWEAGVPLGWPQSPSGAVAAAAGYARVLSALWFLTDSARRRQALDRMAAPEALARLRADQDGIAGGVAMGPLGAGLGRPGVATMLRTSMLGYQLQRYSASQAQVALWAVVLYGNTGGLEPQALYATSTLRLRWMADWKLAEVSTIPGPVPVQGQATPTDSAELIKASQQFKEFDDAPRG
jgi:hypothetical protein